MKKLITLILVVVFIFALCVSSQASGINDIISEAKERQTKAHEAADILRELGYKESSSEIKGLQNIWWDAQYEIEKYNNLEYIGRYWVTGYTAETCRSRSDPAFGITASGAYVTPHYTLAASSKEFSFGTQLYIEGLPVGNGGLMEVQDRGVGVGVIDVCCATLAECYQITGYYDVWRKK